MLWALGREIGWRCLASFTGFLLRRSKARNGMNVSQGAEEQRIINSSKGKDCSKETGWVVH